MKNKFLLGIVLLLSMLPTACTITKSPSEVVNFDSTKQQIIPTIVRLNDNFEVLDLGDGIRIYNNRAVSLLVDNSTFQQILTDSTTCHSIVQIGGPYGYDTKIYDKFGNNFDFIVLRANNTIYPPPNRIAGTSGGSMIYLSYSSGGPLFHEMCHSLAQGKTSFDNISGHWGFSDVYGVLGGWDRSTLKSVGNNLYQASRFSDISSSYNFAPLELYLMGLLPPDAVPAINIAISPSWVEQTQYIFTASGFRTISIWDFIESNNIHAIDSQNSTKSFCAISVMLTTTELSQDEWTKFDNELAYLETQDYSSVDKYDESNFFTATQGLATIQFGNLVFQK